MPAEFTVADAFVLRQVDHRRIVIVAKGGVRVSAVADEKIQLSLGGRNGVVIVDFQFGRGNQACNPFRIDVVLRIFGQVDLHQISGPIEQRSALRT